MTELLEFVQSLWNSRSEETIKNDDKCNQYDKIPKRYISEAYVVVLNGTPIIESVDDKDGYVRQEYDPQYTYVNTKVLKKTYDDKKK